jgi:hypothetical protein
MPIGRLFDLGQIGNTQWDDLSVSAALVKQGANTKPDFDYTNLGLLFPQNDSGEKAHLTIQMPHRKKLGTAVYLHVHYIQAGAAKPNFRADCCFYNNGAAVPSFAAAINTGDAGGSKGVFTYASGSILQIAQFPLIAAPANEGLSANLDVILYRTDNDVAGDVLVKYIDIHYEIDSYGSREEYVK